MTQIENSGNRGMVGMVCSSMTGSRKMTFLESKNRPGLNKTWFNPLRNYIRRVCSLIALPISPSN